MSQSRPPNNDGEDPFTALRRAADQSFNSLFSSLIGLPSTIYKQGSDHGKEWVRLSRGRREGSASAAEDDSADNQTQGGCPYLRNGGPRREAAQAQKGDGNGDDQPEDFIAKVWAEIGKGEQRANEAYDSWKRRMESRDRPDGFGEEVAENLEEKPQERRCRRGGHWWRGHCRRQEKANEESAEISTALQRQTPPGKCTRHEFGWPDEPFQPLPGFEGLLRSVLAGDWLFETGFGLLYQDPTSLPSLVFLFRSPYSPLYLENTCAIDQGWKARYEDLLRVQAGKELMREEDRRSESDIGYVQRVIGLMQEIQTRRQNMSSASDDPDGRMTEEDVYDRFLGDITRTFPSAVSAEVEGQTLMKPDVLSSVTTTERHVAPDGTITTKTVLKRRFADGREENEEKVETSHDPNWTTRRRLDEVPTRSTNSQPKSAVLEELKKKNESQGKKGWFWSN